LNHRPLTSVGVEVYLQLRAPKTELRGMCDGAIKEVRARVAGSKCAHAVRCSERLLVRLLSGRYGVGRAAATRRIRPSGCGKDRPIRRCDQLSPKGSLEVEDPGWLEACAATVASGASTAAPATLSAPPVHARDARTKLLAMAHFLTQG
jgi:hypothetical protein